MKNIKHMKLKVLFTGLFILEFPATDQSGEETADVSEEM